MNAYHWALEAGGLLRAFIFFLSLWLATPAFGNTLEEALCRTTPNPVARMEGSEKLCRSLALALANVPEATSEEVRAMLTPESLAAMMALSAAWMGAQGVPVVGQAVDADGYRSSDAHLLDAKHVEKPDSSPFINGSRCLERVRDSIRLKEFEQFSRYAAVLKDPMTPAVGLEVILNDARAMPFFEGLMRELGIPGRIVVITKSAP
ncbi:restriction endonuclease fold toxin-2 domain-containing protein [Archangium gephyra]|uniref:restriction endonuclease fold toxin-2 domain-containing protein n=1 Tax=Archangium gephyra TaxID=48 RepID=UPI003B76B51A